MSLASAPTKPVRPRISRGRIIFVIPDLNLYGIDPFDQQMPGWIPGIDLRPTSTSRTGVSDITSYAIGTDVFYIELDKGEEGELGDILPGYGLILCAAPLNILDNTTTDPVRALDQNSLITSLSDGVYQELPLMTGAQKFHNRSYGRVIDSIPGDYIKAGPLNNYLKIGILDLVLRASNMCGVSCDVITGTLKLDSENFTHNTPASQVNEYLSGSGYTIIKRIARTILESMGSYDGTSPFKESNGEPPSVKYELSKDYQQGIFRHVLMEGALVEGIYEAVLHPEENSGLRVFSDYSNSHTPLISSQKAYDGVYKITAAKRLSLNRSVYTPFPRELASEELLEEPDIEVEADVITSLSEELLNCSSDYINLIKDARDNRIAERYLARIRAKESLKDDSGNNYWKIFDKEDEIVEGETKLAPLDENNVGYDLSDVPELEIKDPLTQDETLKLKTLLSALEFSEDGGVLLHDGHGSEIKMHRGNITITCPADIRIMPGRDSVQMTPRHHIINGGKRVDISGATGDVTVKAEKNLLMMGGNSGSGYTILENRSEQSGTASNVDYNEGLNDGGGLLIKSIKDAAMVSENMRLGLYSEKDTAKSGLKSKTKTGKLLIDGGNGTVSLTGSVLYGVFNTNISLASVSNGTGSYLGIARSDITSSTNSYNMGFASLTMGGMSSDINTPVIKENGVETDTIGTFSGTSTINLKGSINATQNIRVGNAIVSESIVAGSIASNIGAFTNAAAETQLKLKNPVKYDLPQPEDVSADSANNVLSNIKTTLKSTITTNSLFTGYGVLALGMGYPDSSVYKTDSHFIVESRWQKMLRTNGSYSTWTENPVMLPTGEISYIYPGNTGSGWTKDDYIRTLKQEGLSLTREDLGNLETYIINTE